MSIVISLILLSNLATSFQHVQGAGHAITKRSVTELKVSVGQSVHLPCPVYYPGGVPVKFILKWLHHATTIPVFMSIDNEEPFINARYVGRIHHILPSAINISNIQHSDAGVYTCELVFMDGRSDTDSNNVTYRLLVYVAPTITSISGNMYVLESQTVTLTCTATGVPSPNLVWEKDGKAIQSSVRIKISGNVTIINFQRLDAGVYTCKARNSVGETEKDVHVMLADGPYLINPPVNMTENEGAEVRLPCEAGGYPTNITYRWEKEGEDVFLVDGLKDRVEIFAEGSLHIKPSHRDDTGWYKCRAYNGIGRPKERRCYLSITYMAYVDGQVPREFLPRGLTDKIPCPAKGNPPVTKVEWRKDGKLLNPQGKKYRILPDWSLQIININDGDAGFYKCIPYSDKGQGSTEHNVQVTVRDLPYFLVRPDNIYQRQLGQSVTFPCVATGDPSPVVSWRKVGSSELPEKHKLVSGNLTISDLTKAEHGRYECIAENVVTTVVTSTRLIIELTTPHAPRNLTVTTRQFSAHVSWEPGYHGGLEQYYVLWFIKDGNPNWTSLKVIPDGATDYSIYSLEANTFYWFFVLSRNSKGDGLKSEKVKAKTKGYEPTMPMVLPTDGTGKKYCPPLAISQGERPNPPIDLTVKWVTSEEVLVSWNPPKNLTVPALCYRVEYKPDDEDWKEAKITPATFLQFKPKSAKSYEFRVRSMSLMSFSEMYSLPVTLKAIPEIRLSEPAIWGISAACIAILVVFIVAVVFIVRIRRKKAHQKRVKYSAVNNVKYIDTNHTTHPAPLIMSKEDEPDRGGFGMTRHNRIFLVEESYRQWYKANSLSPKKAAPDPDSHLFEHRIAQSQPEKSWSVNKEQHKLPPPSVNYGHSGSKMSRPNERQLANGENGSDDVFLYPEYNVNYPIPKPPRVPRSAPPSYFSDSQQHDTSHESEVHPYNDGEYPHSIVPSSPNAPLNSRYPLQTDNVSPQFNTHYSGVPSEYNRSPYPPFSAIRDHMALPQGHVPANLYGTALPNWHGHPSTNPHIPMDSFYSTEPSTPNYPSNNRGQIPRHSSMKPSQQTYLTESELQDVPFNSDISSVYPPSSERPSWHQDYLHPNNSPYINMSSIPPFSGFHESAPIRTSSQDKLNNLPGGAEVNGNYREESPSRKIARIPPSPQKSDNSDTNTKPLAYTRDQLQGAVEKVRRLPRSRRQIRNQALQAASLSDGDSFGNSEPDRSVQPALYSSGVMPYKDIPANRVSVTSGSSGRGSSSNGLSSRPLNVRTVPSGYRGNVPLDYQLSHNGHSPDSYSSGVGSGSRNTSRSTSGHLTSQSSGIVTNTEDLSSDAPTYVDSKHKREISGDENYEFDSEPLGSELLDALRTYNQHSTGGRRRSKESLQEPHSGNSSRFDTSTEDAERMARLREEYQQYRRNQDMLRYKTHYQPRYGYELESELL